MTQRKEVFQPKEHAAAHSSRRSRLESLLFSGASPGVALTPIKWPEAQGE